jgi:DNA sulfur modification protein DndB
MKTPAIRASIGSWVYYVATMSFKEISKYVKRVDNELHKSDLLKTMLQRSITDNYKSIAKYIETQEERFFNALILAVYDGEPQWHEVRLEYDDGEEFYNLGILELTDDVKIFPIDGQHRVEGIKKVVGESTNYDSERIPVVFVGHKTDEEGMQRSRRLFSTLNRYAKPVSMRDIIALDEDDAIAIVSRSLIDDNPFFASGQILDSKTKAIPDSNNTAFTTIITFYECNQELIWLNIANKDIKNIDGRKVRGRSKIKEYIRIRPSDSDIEALHATCLSYWSAIVAAFPELSDYMQASPPMTSAYRNRNGGSILFRPAMQIPLAKAVVRIVHSKQESFDSAFRRFPKPLTSLINPIWNNLVWNNTNHTMIMNHQLLTEYIYLYFWERDILTNAEIQKMKNEIKNLRQLEDEADVDDLLSSALEEL